MQELMGFRCPGDVFDYCMIYCTAVRSPSCNFPFLCATRHELSSKVYGLFNHPDVIRIISRHARLGLHPGIITSLILVFMAAVFTAV